MRSFGASSVLASALLVSALAACNSAHPASPADVADTVTRAVLANDFDATAANFDAVTKKTITRSDLGEMSDRMHALGDFKSLTERSAAPDAGKFEYVATFTNGQLLVQLRMDPDGKVGAYRIVPDGAPAAAPGSAKN